MFDPEWRALLEDRMALWRDLGESERAGLEQLVAGFLATVRWEPAKGFTVTEEMRVTIAAQACLLVLGLDLDWYRQVRTVIVHPSSQTQRGERSVGTTGVRTDSPRRIHGRTGPRAPVILAWDAARHDSRHPRRGRNVVHHEFAHQLDALDGVLDGTPPIPRGDLAERWVQVCTAEYQALEVEPRPPLRTYGAHTPAEFFAVATEAFFGVPVELADQRPALYEVLSSFYRQDPAARSRAA